MSIVRCGLPRPSDSCQRHRRWFAELVVGACLAQALATLDAAEGDWTSLGGLAGMNGANFAVACDEAGTTYVGGGFTTAGDGLAYRLAAWKGQSWMPVGGGFNDTVWALAPFGPNLYAAGSFTRATNANAASVSCPSIARWDGSQWSGLGGGLDETVYALAVAGSDLYAAGGFSSATNADGTIVSTPGIARWDGARWASLGGGLNGCVSALATSGSDLYVAGSFCAATNADGSTVVAFKAARWDGNQWHALGQGLDDDAKSLTVVNGSLYCGGCFNNAINGDGSVVPASRIVRWAGDQWTAVGGGLDGDVCCLVQVGADLYAGGRFSVATNADRTTIVSSGVAKWDGRAWSAVGLGTGGTYGGDVYGLGAAGGNVFAVGAFTAVTNAGPAIVNASRIARWNGTRWSRLSESAGLNDVSRCVARLGADVYLGGDFSVAGDCETPGIARWNGREWSPVGKGVNGSVHALVQWGTNLWAGGTFTAAVKATGQLVNAPRLACWDGREWRPVSTGLDGDVYALAPAGDALYVGGAFTAGTNADGSVTPVSRIARWDGRTWSPLAEGLNDKVRTILVRGGEVYVGGSFTAATNTGRATPWNPPPA